MQLSLQTNIQGRLYQNQSSGERTIIFFDNVIDPVPGNRFDRNGMGAVNLQPFDQE